MRPPDFCFRCGGHYVGGTCVRCGRDQVVDQIETKEPIWIVNDMGELGVYVHGRAYFLYKGDNIDYAALRAKYGSDRAPVRYRRVCKREFGECQHSVRQIEAGQANGGDFYEAEAEDNTHGRWVEDGEPPPLLERRVDVLGEPKPQ